jgi:hypothetical protein
MKAKIMSRTMTLACFLLLPLLVLGGFASYAQEKIDVNNYNIEAPNLPSQKKYRAKVTLTNGQKLKGIMTSVGENSIQLEKVVYKNSKRGRPDSQTAISFNEISY